MSGQPPTIEPPQSRVTTASTSQEHREVAPSPRYVWYDKQTNVATTVSSVQSVLPAVEAERRFGVLAEQWYLDTLITSSYFDKILHPAYQKILRLDRAAIPLILRELQAMPNDWFWALRILTDADPVEPEHSGDMQAMADAWIEWGREEGYI